MAGSSNTYLSRIQEKQILRANSTSDGRYIPHSGGLMGWHENAGVLNCEIPNNYKYYMVIQAREVRAKLFSRWSEGEDVSRRASQRSGLNSEVAIEFAWDGQTARGQLRDYSSDGMRIIVTQQDFNLEKGAQPTLRVMKNARSDEVELEAVAEIMWINRTGRDRVVWSMGAMFTSLSPEQTVNFKAFLAK